MWPLMLSVVGARWFRYVAIGLALTAALTYAHGSIYSKGYNAAEDKWKVRMEEMRATMIQNYMDRQNQFILALQSKDRREREANRIKDIPRPDRDLCNAGNDWLHAIQDGVRGANAATEPY